MNAITASMGSRDSGRGFSRAESLISFIVIALCLVGTLGSVLAAQFYMVEDRTLLGIQPWTMQSWFHEVVTEAGTIQRFRPLYVAYVAFGATWFARNPLVWHMVTLLWGVISLFLFYRVARRLGAGIVASALFVAVLAFNGNQSWIWINLIPQETLGVLFLSIAAWAFSIAPNSVRKSGWDALGTLSLIAAGLTKESFVLVIPAMLGFRFLLERKIVGSAWGDCFLALKRPLIAGALFFCIALATIVWIMRSNPTGFSASATGLSFASFNPVRWWGLLGAFGLTAPLLLALGVLAIQGYLRQDKRTMLLLVLLTCMAWLIPQLVLYTKGIDGRYAFPAVIAVVAMITLGFTAAPRRMMWVPQIVILALLLPAVVKGALYANKSANWLAAETVSLDRMVKFVGQNTPASYSVVIAGDAGTGYGLEALYYSLPIYLQLTGSQSPVYAWPLVSKGPRNATQAAQAAAGAKVFDPQTTGPEQVGAIIVIDNFTSGLDTGPVSGWLGRQQWNELHFDESFRYADDSAKDLASDMVRHKVLIPAKRMQVNDLVTIERSLADLIGVDAKIDGPPWGLEKDYAGPGKIAWIGYGDTQGLGGTFMATAAHRIKLTVHAIPGPSRDGYERTAELALGRGPEQRVVSKKFNGDIWEFEAELQPGENPFRLRVVDRPTVAHLPNGDTRTLMALVRRITVSE